MGSPALPKQGNFEKPNWVPRLGLNSDENGGIWFLSIVNALETFALGK